MTLRCGQTLCAEVTYFSDLAVEVLAALRGFHYGGRGGQGVCFVCGLVLLWHGCMAIRFPQRIVSHPMRR